MWFFGWGFRSLEHDDALELKLTGHQTRSRPSTEDDESTSSKSPDVSTQAARADSANSYVQGTVNDSIVAVDIEIDDKLVTLPTHQVCNQLPNRVEGKTCCTSEGTAYARQATAGAVVLSFHDQARYFEGQVGSPTTSQGGQQDSSRLRNSSISNERRLAGGVTKAKEPSNIIEGGSTGGGAGYWTELKHFVLNLIASPNIIAVIIGVIIAMIAPLQSMLFDNPQGVLRPIGAALEVGRRLNLEVKISL